MFFFFFFFQAEDGIRDVERSRGLGDVYKRQLLEEDKKKVKCELEELHLQFFKSLKEGATEEEINRICGMPGDQNDLEDVSIHEEDEEPHAAKVTENQPYHLSLIHI
eukprot:TRINITY_DN15422_c0_g1_i2.p3 TRINITY_DN15422_c0_g1~~TRINITY_DN15422_c0_g1_i2.p3  ORF type:complete len:107 (+),score=39.81 TRINITY_DN15422_c0_g1_i2:81-401(+)